VPKAITNKCGYEYRRKVGSMNRILKGSHKGEVKVDITDPKIKVPVVFFHLQ
jgi:hypothetical protein